MAVISSDMTSRETIGVAIMMIICLLIACGRYRSSTGAAPPRQVDRLSDLRRAPIGDIAQPNPPPASWMLGCYKVSVADAEEHKWRPPTLVHLTDERGTSELVTQHYHVQDIGTGVTPELWRWTPTTPSEVRVSIGTGFWGWQFYRRPDPTGLRGTAKFWTDTADSDSHTHTARFVRVRCE